MVFLHSILLFICCYNIETYVQEVSCFHFQYVTKSKRKWSTSNKYQYVIPQTNQYYRYRFMMNNDDGSNGHMNMNVDDDNNNNQLLIEGTIQILMSDTGGGHRASANALRDAFNILYPNQIECDIVDIYTDYGPFWPFNDYVNMYKLMAHHSWTWDLFYHFGETDFGLILNEFILNLFCFIPFTQCIERLQNSTNKRADMIISVHPLTQDIPLNILGYLDSMYSSRSWTARTKTPFVTVVTDLGSAHPTWFHRGVDRCYVPSDALHQKALDRGLSEQQIKQYGLPIRRGFWNEYCDSDNCIVDIANGDKIISSQKEQLRMELQLQTDLPTVLIVGGGDGMGGIINLAKELGDRLGSLSSSSSSSYQIVVVCGKNDIAKKELEEYQFPNNVSVIIKGFVNNMDQYMKASDVLVTKAGPGTIAEASICGLPCMMFSFL